MKKLNYIAISLAVLCFAGVVFASNTMNVIPETSKVVSYLNQAHLQDQAYWREFEMPKEFIKNKDKFEGQEDVQYLDNDVIIKGTSLKDTAKNKVITENRITGLFKLLVPEIADFDMNTITYDMIEEMFPFSIQMDIIEAITETVSPAYKATRGK